MWLREHQLLVSSFPQPVMSSWPWLKQVNILSVYGYLSMLLFQAAERCFFISRSIYDHELTWPLRASVNRFLQESALSKMHSCLSAWLHKHSFAALQVEKNLYQTRFLKTHTRKYCTETITGWSCVEALFLSTAILKRWRKKPCGRAVNDICEDVRRSGAVILAVENSKIISLRESVNSLSWHQISIYSENQAFEVTYTPLSFHYRTQVSMFWFLSWSPIWALKRPKPGVLPHWLRPPPPPFVNKLLIHR